MMQGIGWAVEKMQDGARVRREGWNGKGMWLSLVRPATETLPFRLPYVEMFTAQGQLVPWLCSQTDLLADDWELADG